MSFNTVFQFVGDGVTTDYLFATAYIEQSDVHGYVAGAIQTVTYPDSTHLRFSTAPANGADVIIRRETDRNFAVAIFADPTNIASDDLNINQIQSLYIAQEMDDVSTASFDLIASGSFAADAAASAAAALVSENAASASETQAGLEADDSLTAANLAGQSETQATIKAGEAATSAGNALASSDNSDINAGVAFDNAVIAFDSAAEAELSALAASAYEVERPNLLINGSLQIWQRATARTAVGDEYVADRWRNIKNGGSSVVSIDQIYTSVVQFQPPVPIMTRQVTTAGAPTSAGFRYILEGLDFTRVQSTAMTLSFNVRSSITGIHSVSLRNHDHTRSYVAEYTITTALAWQKVEITIPVDTDNNWKYDTDPGLEISFISSATGGTASLGSWLNGNEIASVNQVQGESSVGFNFALATVKLEAGVIATAFTAPTYANELDSCKRYYRHNEAMEGHIHTSTTTTARFGSIGYINMRTTTPAFSVRLPISAILASNPITFKTLTGTILTANIAQTDLSMTSGSTVLSPVSIRPNVISMNADYL